jgi:hypothetical protein
MVLATMLLLLILLGALAVRYGADSRHAAGHDW